MELKDGDGFMNKSVRISAINPEQLRQHLTMLEKVDAAIKNANTEEEPINSVASPRVRFRPLNDEINKLKRFCRELLAAIEGELKRLKQDKLLSKLRAYNSTKTAFQAVAVQVMTISQRKADMKKLQSLAQALWEVDEQIQRTAKQQESEVRRAIKEIRTALVVLQDASAGNVPAQRQLTDVLASAQATAQQALDLSGPALQQTALTDTTAGRSVASAAAGANDTISPAIHGSVGSAYHDDVIAPIVAEPLCMTLAEFAPEFVQLPRTFAEFTQQPKTMADYLWQRDTALRALGINQQHFPQTYAVLADVYDQIERLWREGKPGSAQRDKAERMWLLFTWLNFGDVLENYLNAYPSESAIELRHNPYRDKSDAQIFAHLQAMMTHTHKTSEQQFQARREIDYCDRFLVLCSSMKQRRNPWDIFHKTAYANAAVVKTMQEVQRNQALENKVDSRMMKFIR